MDPDDIPKIFKDMGFYVRAYNHPKRVELVHKLKSRGGIEVDQPNHPLCKAIFVFASSVQPYIIKGEGKARPLETCLNEKTWTFHDLCTHFGRRQGDKEKRQGFVVDSSWVDLCILKGAMVQRKRWSGKEILVKKIDRNSIPAIPTSIQSALPLTPASLMSTPFDSPATRQSTGAPALETAQRQDDIVDQVNKSDASAITQRNLVAAADRIFSEQRGIFTSFTERSESFHVYPHRGLAKLVASINDQGGQVVDDIKLADYIIVDRDSVYEVPALESTQEMIDAIWIDHSLNIGSAQNIRKYIITPGKIPTSSIVDNKPQVTPGPSASSQTQSSTTGRKRPATLSAPEPVAKMKRPGTPKATQASLTDTIRASASVINYKDKATTTTYSLSGLFQIASENDTPVQKESRKYYVDHVVEELDKWCGNQFAGTRTAFLISKRREINPEFDRVAFFSYNKKAILRGLSQRGRDVGLGSELYEGARRSGKASAVKSNSSEPIRPIQSGSSTLQTPTVSATPKSSTVSKPLSIRIAPPPVGHVSTASKKTVNASASQQMKRPSSADLSTLARGRRAVTPGSTYLEEKRERQLATIINELNRWCLDGSEGSRSAHLAKMTEANPIFNRASFFTRHREEILEDLHERGRDVSEGTKVYGVNQYGPRRFSFHNNGSDVVETRKSSVPSGTGFASRVPSMSTSLQQRGRRDRSEEGIHRGQIDKEQFFLQIVQELHEWVDKGSRKTRSDYLKGLDQTKPGRSRILFFRKNKKEILEALLKMGHDVSEGTKLYGMDLDEARRYRYRHSRKGKEGNGQRPNLNTSEASSPASIPHGDTRELSTVRPASSSFRHSDPDSRSTFSVPRSLAEDEGNDPLPSPYDVPLPCSMSMKSWMTRPEDEQGKSTFL